MGSALILLDHSKMHLKVMYLLFSALFGARSHGGPYRGDGSPGYLAHPQQGGSQEWLPGADDDDNSYNGSGPASQYFIHLDILMLMMIIIRNQQQMHNILKLKSQEQNQKVQVYQCKECGKQAGAELGQAQLKL